MRLLIAKPELAVTLADADQHASKAKAPRTRVRPDSVKAKSPATQRRKAG
jgi:hypothetical protein